MQDETRTNALLANEDETEEGNDDFNPEKQDDEDDLDDDDLDVSADVWEN